MELSERLTELASKAASGDEEALSELLKDWQEFRSVTQTDNWEEYGPVVHSIGRGFVHTFCSTSDHAKVTPGILKVISELCSQVVSKSCLHCEDAPGFFWLLQGIEFSAQCYDSEHYADTAYRQADDVFHQMAVVFAGQELWRRILGAVHESVGNYALVDAACTSVKYAAFCYEKHLREYRAKRNPNPNYDATSLSGFFANFLFSNNPGDAVAWDSLKARLIVSGADAVSADTFIRNSREYILCRSQFMEISCVDADSYLTRSYLTRLNELERKTAAYQESLKSPEMLKMQDLLVNLLQATEGG